MTMTVKPLYSGHLWDFPQVSTIQRCPLQTERLSLFFLNIAMEHGSLNVYSTMLLHHFYPSFVHYFIFTHKKKNKNTKKINTEKSSL